MEYDFFAFMNEGNPVWVKTIQREQHYQEEENSPTIEKVEYSDGFGRLLQTRSQAEDVIFGNQTFGSSGLPNNQSAQNAPAVGVERASEDPLNVVVSGWQIYNNKGEVVEQYEPFFDKGFEYTLPQLSTTGGVIPPQLGVKVKMYYDPLGRVIRTKNPDNSEQRVIYGIPNALDTPNIFAPTSWEQYTYDANDLAPLTNPTNSNVPASHYYTPKSGLMDALGRTIETREHKAHYNSDGDVYEDVVMKYRYDIRGNLLEVRDPYNRKVFEHLYDFRPPQKDENGEQQPLSPLWTKHIDAGISTIFFDVAERVVEMNDAKGAFTLNSYDDGSRPIRLWVKDKTGENVTLRQVMEYGDNAGLINPENENLKGQIYKHYDEAGLVKIPEYDFKGNVLTNLRQVISDSEILSVLGSSTVNCYRVNWTGFPNILDTTSFEISSEYDALNRIVKMLYPEDVENERKELVPAYNRAGAMESIKMDGNDYVNHITYNAKGQRLLITLGNNVMTRYTYNNKTNRLQRLKSEKFAQTGWVYTPQSGTVLQDYAYEDDLIGNIVEIRNKTPECGIGGINTLDRNFTYDPLYRLLSANGRENSPTITPIWDDRYRSTDDSATTAYTQYYSYDRLGNIQKLQHIGNNNFTRNFNYTSNNNQLQSIDIGMTNYAFAYDNCGNQTQETSSRHFEWDLTNQLRSFYVFDGSTVSQYTHYLYDASGNRVKKLVWKQNGDYQSSTYIGNAFEYLTNGTEEQNTLHVMNDTSRIALIRLGDNFGDTTPAIKYNLEDHLGSSSVLIEDNGTLINREEYYPFGETSFGSYAKKKYKYSGKERDEESGMYYFKFRYQSAWTCRFISVDPISADYPFNSSYAFCENRVISGIELEGLEQIDHHILVQIQESTSALNVNMDLAPKSYLGETTRALGGRKWNARWFWSEALKQDASWFSPENQASINKGNIPTLDETYLKKMGANLSKSDFAKLRNNVTIGQTLEHHHMNHGRFTVGLPQSVHRGAGNNNFWHNPSFRNGMSKLAKGGVKAIAVLGVVFSVYDAMANNELSIIPVDFSSGWVDILEKGLKENNFTIVDAGLYNLNKFSQNYSVEWMTVDDMITFQNTGEAKGVYGGNVPAWKNQNQIRHDVYPYMLIKFKDNVVGIVTVPDK